MFDAHIIFSIKQLQLETNLTFFYIVVVSVVLYYIIMLLLIIYEYGLSCITYRV